MTQKRYLIQNRLADVITLIQFLSQDEWAHRKDTSLEKALGRSLSGGSWKDIIQQHPEFFRYAEQKENSISLIMRHLNRDGEESYERLAKAETIALIETAIKLYEGELESSRWWTYWVPVITLLIGAFIGGIVPLIGKFFGNLK